jgi:outer membrane lipoprotein carrier protein
MQNKMYKYAPIGAIKRACFTVSIVLTSAFFTVGAQTQSAADKLKPILDNLQSYRGNFVQKIADAEGAILQQTQGNITLQKPSKLRWEVTAPDQSLFVADGDIIYNLDPFVEQVTMLDQADIVNNNPLMLLISDDPEAWENVEIMWQADSYVIRTNNENANIMTLQLTFDNGVLSAMTSTDRQQQSNIIVFSDIQQNVDISEAAFTVEVPENYVVDDQRKNSQRP